MHFFSNFILFLFIFFANFSTQKLLKKFIKNYKQQENYKFYLLYPHNDANH